MESKQTSGGVIVMREHFSCVVPRRQHVHETRSSFSSSHPQYGLSFFVDDWVSKVLVSATGHCWIYLVILKSLFPQFLFISLVSQTREEVFVCSLWLEKCSKTTKQRVSQGWCKRECRPRGQDKGHWAHMSCSGGGCLFHGSQLTTRGRKEIVKSGEEGDFIQFPLYSQNSVKGLYKGWYQ